MTTANAHISAIAKPVTMPPGRRWSLGIHKDCGGTVWYIHHAWGCYRFCDRCGMNSMNPWPDPISGKMRSAESPAITEDGQ